MWKQKCEDFSVRITQQMVCMCDFPLVCFLEVLHFWVFCIKQSFIYDFLFFSKYHHLLSLLFYVFFCFVFYVKDWLFFQNRPICLFDFVNHFYVDFALHSNKSTWLFSWFLYIFCFTCSQLTGNIFRTLANVSTKRYLNDIKRFF